MPLKRPPRAPADAITERVRRAILLSAERIGVTANVLLACHGQAEHIASPADLVEDVEERYALPASSLAKQVNERLTQIAQRAGRSGRIPQWLYDEHAPQCILLSLPDTEFLTVLEHVLDVGYRDNVLDAQMASELLQAADGCRRTALRIVAIQTTGAASPG